MKEAIHIVPVTWKKHTNNLGSQTLVFELDDLNNALIEKLAVMPQGTPMLLVIYEIVEGEDPLKKVRNGEGGMSNTFMKQIYARIKEYEKETGVGIEQIKKLLKLKLKAKGIDKKSLSELTETELSTAVVALNVDLNPSRFNYEEYLNK